MLGTREHSRSPWQLLRGVLLVAVGMAGGCSSLPKEQYTFQELPGTYMAAKRENPHTLDLTKLATASKPSNVIDRGDVIEVAIAASLDSKDKTVIPVRVLENGLANLPLIGQIPLAGQDPEEAEATIVAACIERDLYRNPHVTVTMKRQRTNRVLVTGAVEKPGFYELPRGKSDLLAAITEAGMLSKDAGTMVEIRNPQRNTPGTEPARIAEGDDAGGVNAAGHSLASGGTMSSVRVNLISATQGAGGQYLVDDGGVVHVEKRDPEPIFVQGLVARPDRYEYPPAEELRLLGAVALAGGLSNPAADQVYVIRRKPNSTDTFIVNLKISDAKRSEQANLLLSPGDVVSVEQTPQTVMMDVFRRINFGIGATLPMTMFF